jgi:hypothetical protein
MPQNDSPVSSNGGRTAGTAPNEKTTRGNVPSVQNINTFSQAFKSLNILDENQVKTRTLIEEIKTLKINKQPNAFAILFRVILEASVRGYCLRNSIQTKHQPPHGNKEIELQTLCEIVSKNLVERGIQTQKELQSSNTIISSKQSPLSITNMNHAVHGTYTVTAANIPSELNNWKPFLFALHKK